LRVHDKGMEEHSAPPPGQPGYGPPPGTPTSKGSGLSRHRLRNPLSIILIAVIVIGLVAAGLLAGELYARHRAESVVAAATECVVQDNASVSFGATPLLLQLATGHYRNISIRTAGNRIGNARGMKADVRIDDVRLDGDADAMGTVGALDAIITWSIDGIRQSIQEAISPLRGLVTGVQANSDDGTIKLQGNLGSVTTKPQVTDGRVALQVVDVTGLGLLLPSEMVQSALDAFTTHLTENLPLDIHADSVQVADDVVTAHYSARNTPIQQSNQGNQGDHGDKNTQDPCFAKL
jgi:LmeA-like phospholipid-binding